LAAFIH
jgi:hypothetical protein